MAQCPKCKTENKKGSRFCKQCGISLQSGKKNDASDATRNPEKRDRVLGKGKKGMPWKPLAAVAVVAALLAVFMFSKTRSPGNAQIAQQHKVAEYADYGGEPIRMTEITSAGTNGRIVLSLPAIKEAKLVRTEYGSGKLPLLAYVAPSGKLVTAVSMCEPCRSTRFHIQDNMLVCNACFTKWDLENLKGIQGGCMDYPPDVLPSVVDGEDVLIDEQLVLNWKPR
ncbi:MAG: Fe-S-containing protein, partial [Candidatus Latescibacterota bacterium]